MKIFTCISILCLLVILFFASEVNAIKCVQCASCTQPWSNSSNAISQCPSADLDTVYDFKIFIIMLL